MRKDKKYYSDLLELIKTESIWPFGDYEYLNVTAKHEIFNISLYVCNNMTFSTNVNWYHSLDKSTKASQIPLNKITKC